MAPPSICSPFFTLLTSPTRSIAQNPPVWGGFCFKGQEKGYSLQKQKYEDSGLREDIGVKDIGVRYQTILAFFLPFSPTREPVNMDFASAKCIRSNSLILPQSYIKQHWPPTKVYRYRTALRRSHRKKNSGKLRPDDRPEQCHNKQPFS